jgi:hypothetical protein
MRNTGRVQPVRSVEILPHAKFCHSKWFGDSSQHSWLARRDTECSGEHDAASPVGNISPRFLLAPIEACRRDCDEWPSREWTCDPTEETSSRAYLGGHRSALSAGNLWNAERRASAHADPAECAGGHKGDLAAETGIPAQPAVAGA